MAFFGLSTARDVSKKPAEKPSPDARIAPEPLAAVLPALAALGSIASIAAINWVGQDKSGLSPKRRRKVASTIRDLESDCLRLQEIFKRLIRIYRTMEESGASAALSLPIKFGVHGLSIALSAFPDYQRTVADIAAVVASASQTSFDVMTAIEDGEIEAPEELFYAFGEQQERLNAVLVKRESLKAALGMGLGVSEKLTGLVRELRQYAVE